jgi:hypothetical protein
MYWDVGLLRIGPLPSGEFELAKEPVGFFVLHVDVLVGWSRLVVDVICCVCSFVSIAQHSC